MVQQPSSEVTALLRAWSGGDEDALAGIVKVVYPELRDIARKCLSREPSMAWRWNSRRITENQGP